MAQFLALLLAIAPCLFWLWAVVRHDDHEAEPWAFVVLALLAGALSTTGVLWLHAPLAAWLGHGVWWMDDFVTTAAHEEVWKLAALLPFLLHPETDEPLDGGVYGAAVGLGFAAAENVLYVEYGGDALLALQRAFTATLMHAACTGCLGIAWATGKLRRRGVGTFAWPAFGLALAVALHGLYDHFLAGDRAHGRIALLAVLPVAIVLLMVKVRWARSRSTEFHPPT